ncbi:VWA domain-containing protein [Candidatus Woesearchaeota archaeon]|nr:VWA domain-containing protein [Candidatus Woesearchaeota archaeon]
MMRSRVVAGSRDLSQEKLDLKKEKLSSAEELTGKLDKQSEQDKLMNSVLENDKQTIDDGKLLNDAINSGFSSFTPDMMFEKLVKDYSMAKHIYGEKIIRALFGYDPDYIEKNVSIPEFQRELKKRIAERIEGMKERKLIDKSMSLTEKGYELASIVLYSEELNRLAPKGLIGEKLHKKKNSYGEKQEIRPYKKDDSYRDFAVRMTIKTALRRGHGKASAIDFRSYTHMSKGRVNVIYAVDSSGSMKGKKIENCKRAGVALAFKAIEEKDKVGLIVFGKDVRTRIMPSADFPMLLSEISRIRASNETDIAATIKSSIELFPDDDSAKHLILLTDALPTVGENPQEDTLKAASVAKAAGITISLIGINLDNKGAELAEKITEIGEGKLYIAKETEDIDVLVLDDYYGLS